MKRDHHLDIIKGLAVIAMSFVHVNIFFLNQRSFLLDRITKWGAISCFSTFILISGILGGMSLKNRKQLTWLKTIKKIFYIYITYLVIALTSLYVTKDSLRIVDINNIIILRELPLLSEYLITFILFYLFFKITYKPLLTISKSWLVLLAMSILIYLFGGYIYNADFFNKIWFKGLFVGIGDYHYFPLFQYLPIYLLGIFLGRHSKAKYYVIAFLTVLISYLFIKFFGFSLWRRFPPTQLFLIQSLLIPLAILVLLKGFKLKIQIPSIEIFAKNSLLSLLVLTVLTLILTLFLPISVPMLSVWVINIGVLLITAILLLAYKKISKMV